MPGAEVSLAHTSLFWKERDIMLAGILPTVLLFRKQLQTDDLLRRENGVVVAWFHMYFVFMTPHYILQL